MNLAPYRKLIVALIGAVATAVSLGLVPEEVGDWLAVAVAFVTALGDYAVPNTGQARDRSGRFVSQDGQVSHGVLLVVVILLVLVILLATGRL